MSRSCCAGNLVVFGLSMLVSAAAYADVLPISGVFPVGARVHGLRRVRNAPDVIATSGGEFIIAWCGYNELPAPQYDLFERRFTADVRARGKGPKQDTTD